MTRRPARSLALLAAVALIGAAAWLGLRTPVLGKYDPLPTGFGPALLYVIATLLLLGAVAAGFGARRRLAGIVGAAAAAMLIVMCVAIGSRVRLVVLDRSIYDHWPPRVEELSLVRIDSLADSLQANWAVRVAAHWLSAHPGELAIPRSWPFPVRAEIALRVERDRVQYWARVGNALTCLERRSGPADSVCTTAAPTVAARLPFAQPARSNPAPPIALASTAGGAAWPQYRATSDRAGAWNGTDTPVAVQWHAASVGPMRSTPSVAGRFVIAGTHDNGIVSAIDPSTGVTGWTGIVPNWVHQDPVSDGQVVVIGFGDNLASFAGRAPSGVAAYEVATGRHLWTAFDQGSVMTSPVISGDAIVYGTGAGHVKRRRISDGALLAEGMLPGFVTMAPPAITGDTVVFTLDHDTVCAISAVTLSRMWCRSFPHHRYLGHAAPAIRDGLVVLSGVVAAGGVTWAEFRGLPRDLQWRLLHSVLVASEWDVQAGQRVMAVRLADGVTVWASSLYAEPRLVVGHTSGTAALAGRVGAIILPVSDTLIAFDIATGRTMWTAPGQGGRGPPLIVDGHVIVTGRTGVIEARSLETGRISCVSTRARGFDRTGPVVWGRTAIIADLRGDIDAIPLDGLLSCPASGTR